MSLSMRNCGHYIEDRCTHPAQPYGARPSPGVCAQVCRHRIRFRGLGDVVAAAISWLPFRKVKEMQLPVARGGCSSCHQRQEALNQTVNFSRCGSCARSAPKSSDIAQGG